jgi:hypothetical protein
MRFQTGRVEDQHWLEPPADLLDLGDPEAGVKNELLGRAVPMAIAHAAPRQWHQRILDPWNHLPWPTHMFEEQQRAAWFEHAPDFAQAARRILHGTKDERCDRTVKLCRRERQRLDRGTRQADGHGHRLTRNLVLLEAVFLSSHIPFYHTLVGCSVTRLRNVSGQERP